MSVYENISEEKQDKTSLQRNIRVKDALRRGTERHIKDHDLQVRCEFMQGREEVVYESGKCRFG